MLLRQCSECALSRKKFVPFGLVSTIISGPGVRVLFSLIPKPRMPEITIDTTIILLCQLEGEEGSSVVEATNQGSFTPSTTY